MKTVVILTSNQGDWVRVMRGNDVLLDAHSVSALGLERVLERLGFTVESREVPQEELE